MRTSLASHELRIAETIMAALPAGTWMRISDEHDVISFSVRVTGLKLKRVVFSRASLVNLVSDAAQLVKVDYLKRDLLRTAERRSEFRYPRGVRMSAAPRRSKRMALIAAATLV